MAITVYKKPNPWEEVSKGLENFTQLLPFFIKLKEARDEATFAPLDQAVKSHGGDYAIIGKMVEEGELTPELANKYAAKRGIPYRKAGENEVAAKEFGPIATIKNLVAPSQIRKTPDWGKLTPQAQAARGEAEAKAKLSPEDQFKAIQMEKGLVSTSHQAALEKQAEDRLKVDKAHFEEREARIQLANRNKNMLTILDNAQVSDPQGNIRSVTADEAQAIAEGLNKGQGLPPTLSWRNPKTELERVKVNDKGEWIKFKVDINGKPIKDTEHPAYRPESELAKGRYISEQINKLRDDAFKQAAFETGQRFGGSGLMIGPGGQLQMNWKNPEQSIKYFQMRFEELQNQLINQAKKIGVLPESFAPQPVDMKMINEIGKRHFGQQENAVQPTKSTQSPQPNKSNVNPVNMPTPKKGTFNPKTGKIDWE